MAKIDSLFHIPAIKDSIAAFSSKSMYSEESRTFVIEAIGYLQSEECDHKPELWLQENDLLDLGERKLAVDSQSPLHD
ncbi:MAG: hypothetical protein NPIRA04_28340 [Nitrospirales bacterium]|nr:MAG: hypothetical protein NPIRA04_28340 [Nitrospirales bacterium]